MGFFSVIKGQTTLRGNPAKTGHSGNMGNRYIQKIVVPQSIFSLPTSVAASADYNPIGVQFFARIETIVSNS